MGADCKSVGLRLQRFESSTCHPDQAPFRGGLIALRARPLRSSRGGTIECDAHGVEIVR